MFIGGDEDARGWLKALHNEDDDDTKDGWNTTRIRREMRDIRIYNGQRPDYAGLSVRADLWPPR